MCVNATRLLAKRLIPQVRQGDLTVISLPCSGRFEIRKWLGPALTEAVHAAFSARFEENVGAAVPAAISVSVATINRRSETGSHAQPASLAGRVMQAGKRRMGSAFRLTGQSRAT